MGGGGSGEVGASEAISLVLRIATVGLSLASAIMTAASTQCVYRDDGVPAGTVSYGDYYSFKYSALTAVLQSAAIYLEATRKGRAARAVELIDKLAQALTSTSGALLLAVDDITSCGGPRDSRRAAPARRRPVRPGRRVLRAASIYTRHAPAAVTLAPAAPKVEVVARRDEEGGGKEEEEEVEKRKVELIVTEKAKEKDEEKKEDGVEKHKECCRRSCTERALNREKLKNQKESHASPDLKNKLADTFGHWLHKEMIHAICDIVHRDKQTKCISCKATSDALVERVTKLLIAMTTLAMMPPPNTPTVLLSQSNDDAQSAHGVNAPTVLASPTGDSTSTPSVNVANVSLPEDAKGHQVQKYDGKESAKVVEASLPEEAKSCQAGLCSQLTPVKKQSYSQHTGADQQYNGKEHIESVIKKLHRPEFPCIETPVVKQGSLNPSIAAKSKSVCPVPCKTTKPVPEPTIHCSHDCDVVITKAIPSINNPTTPCPQTIDVEPVKRSNSDPQGSPVVQLVGEVTFSKKSSQMSKLTDHMYNSKHLSNVKTSLLTHTQAKPLVGPKVQSNTKKPDRICASIPRNPNPDVNRFPVTLVNVRFYDILCGLAHSQWKGEVAVQLVKTTMNFESLGESIEPAGHCDNFFIAGHCRNFFELEHPRNSRKHYFYPKVGYSLLLYKSPYHENVVIFSFLGANSALKLHLADKLCFPVCHDAHWFVFIVDLKNKYFIFMDSIYNQFHAFQIFVRNKIIKTFKFAWFLHAEVKLDLSDFTILYPPVPKQTNA
ncbi:hypothetical protein C2845_PM05G15860 [Panicum miliaceum]|uniref:Ubiquitin-like protease family profile domain-containing protein n=1 Tax=Panicum miliaceum TaxID=4540 RepID=A0A3L6SSZ0_PANMI|nr:hypothetical protein C2845_PM05G15860 [Panicum miliaceum]